MGLSKSDILATWDPRRIYSFGCLFHGVRDPNSILCRQNAQETLNTWDVISTSFCLNILKDSIYPVGLLLAVMPQNILGTHAYDIWFPNHIGTDLDRSGTVYPNDMIRAASLTKALRTGIDKRGGDSIQYQGGFRKLMNPADLNKEQHNRGRKYNEVLVVGREGVNIYDGFNATREIKVLGIFDGSRGRSSAVSEGLQRANPFLNVFKTPGEIKMLQNEVDIFFRANIKRRI